MKKRILIVVDNIALSHIQKDWLVRDGYSVATVMNEPLAHTFLRKARLDLILPHARLPQGDGIHLLEWIGKEKMDIPFVIMTEYASITDAVKAIKMGAKDYLSKPVYHEQLVEMVKELLKPIATMRSKEKELFKRISPKAREAEHLAEIVASSDITVLILGANGTGKESIARSIHFHSTRKDMPFVAVNCGAIPRELAASMFFGHTKGAFTGADTDKGGYFDAAKGGTLFLDEIGTLPFDMQSSLLRVLQEGTFMPVGSSRERVADVRIVAATNENLEQAIEKGTFREDLFHRINEFTLRMPDLKERKEDILLFANFFLDQANKELDKHLIGFDSKASQALLNYHWPGNLRQMKNIVKRATLLAQGSFITLLELGTELLETSTVCSASMALRNEETEKEHILEALRQTGNNKSKAAQLLNIDRKTLYNKLKLYNIDL